MMNSSLDVLKMAENSTSRETPNIMNGPIADQASARVGQEEQSVGPQLSVPAPNSTAGNTQPTPVNTTLEPTAGATIAASSTVVSSPSTIGIGQKPMRIAITLPTNAYFVSGIRDFTLGLIRNMTEFSEQWAFRFQSVVDELCNNAIEHGSSPGADITVIFINQPHESIEIIVQDTGTGKTKLSAEELQRIVLQRRDPSYVHQGIRGRGLSKIVSEWTDELTFSDLPNGGIEVRIKKFLQNPSLQSEMSNVLESPTHLVLN